MTLVLTYAHRSPVEHRPSTTPRHRTLFWATLVIPDQLVPCCFSSASVSRLQLLRGRPLFLFPCGFQVRAWRVVLDAGFLRVCPIQPHFFAVSAWPLVPVPLAPTFDTQCSMWWRHSYIRQTPFVHLAVQVPEILIIFFF